MRDDIHKRVPRPFAVQRWVKRCLNDADRLNGRSLDALKHALADYCARELPPSFIAGMQRELSGDAGMFAPLEMVTGVRQVGGNGRPLQLEVLSEARRLIAIGTPRESALSEAIARSLTGRCEADIRATQPILPARDPKTQTVLGQMRADVQAVDCRAYAEGLCATTRPVGPAKVDQIALANENLIQNFKPRMTTR